MPILEITTNISKSKVPNEFFSTATAAIAKMTSKPESSVQVIVNADQLISCAGKQDASALVRFSTKGRIEKEMVTELTELISSGLSIATDRFYMTLHELDPRMLAYKGSTFA